MRTNHNKKKTITIKEIETFFHILDSAKVYSPKYLLVTEDSSSFSDDYWYLADNNSETIFSFKGGSYGNME